jgi:hypothetical protein
VFDADVAESIDDVCFVAWYYEVFAVCDIVVFMCYVEDACQCFATCVLYELFIVVYDCLQVEVFGPLCEQCAVPVAVWFGH